MKKAILAILIVCFLLVGCSGADSDAEPATTTKKTETQPVKETTPEHAPEPVVEEPEVEATPEPEEKEDSGSKTIDVMELRDKNWVGPASMCRGLPNSYVNEDDECVCKEGYDFWQGTCVRLMDDGCTTHKECGTDECASGDTLKIYRCDIGGTGKCKKAERIFCKTVGKTSCVNAECV